ncbi:MAG: dCTP deaminase [Nostoc sp.]|uniref:dCTP deaminase n=1 Tax=Nostoc sp. TaxID=1180 RepID=UPI002FF00266
MLKNDKWIKSLAEGLISPFQPRIINEGLSYGLGSFGYDIRLSALDFRIFCHIPGKVVDPLEFNPEHLESAKLHSSLKGDYFILPGHTYGLGVAIERLNVPRNITVVCLGKSTYARVGVIVNVTPAEAGWRGNLTLEFSNSSCADVKIYANKGALQLLFLEGEECDVSYADRNQWTGGKYQDQTEEVVLPKVGGVKYATTA